MFWFDVRCYIIIYYILYYCYILYIIHILLLYLLLYSVLLSSSSFFISSSDPSSSSIYLLFGSPSFPNLLIQSIRVGIWISLFMYSSNNLSKQLSMNIKRNTHLSWLKKSYLPSFPSSSPNLLYLPSRSKSCRYVSVLTYTYLYSLQQF